MTTVGIPANFKHEKFREDVANLMKKWAGHLSHQELLAIFAYALGQTIALVDQTQITPAMAMELIGRNIDAGNKYVIDKLISQTDGLTRQ